MMKMDGDISKLKAKNWADQEIEDMMEDHLSKLSPDGVEHDGYASSPENKQWSKMPSSKEIKALKLIIQK